MPLIIHLKVILTKNIHSNDFIRLKSNLVKIHYMDRLESVNSNLNTIFLVRSKFRIFVYLDNFLNYLSPKVKIIKVLIPKKEFFDIKHYQIDLFNYTT